MEKKQCKAISKLGKRCRRTVIFGDYCYTHLEQNENFKKKKK